jgi:hypothetical protein
MTKTEQGILERVRQTNDLGALRGLAVCPSDSWIDAPQFRFVKRLMVAGEIAWVSSALLGSGWVLKGRNPNKPQESQR